jgi:hypothetical protein
MSSVYYENLIERVLDLSKHQTWNLAVGEWYIYSCKEDIQCSSQCVCGKENIKYLFTIRNLVNGNVLYPIGSSCIKKFGRNDLNEQISICEQMFKLLNAVKNKEFITLDYFSRKLLLYLFEQGAFQSTAFNKFNGKNDYEFMVDMFNRRRKPTEAQAKKIRGIIFCSLIPFLQKQVHKTNLFGF